MVKIVCRRHKSALRPEPRRPAAAAAAATHPVITPSSCSCCCRFNTRSRCSICCRDACYPSFTCDLAISGYVAVEHSGIPCCTRVPHPLSLISPSRALQSPTTALPAPAAGPRVILPFGIYKRSSRSCSCCSSKRGSCGSKRSRRGKRCGNHGARSRRSPPPRWKRCVVGCRP